MCENGQSNRVPIHRPTKRTGDSKRNNTSTTANAGDYIAMPTHMAGGRWMTSCQLRLHVHQLLLLVVSTKVQGVRAVCLAVKVLHRTF